MPKWVMMSGQGGGTGGVEWSNSAYILKIEPKVFAHGLDIGGERKKRDEDEAEVFGLCSEKDKADVQMRWGRLSAAGCLGR